MQICPEDADERKQVKVARVPLFIPFKQNPQRPYKKRVGEKLRSHRPVDAARENPEKADEAGELGAGAALTHDLPQKAVGEGEDDAAQKEGEREFAELVRAEEDQRREPGVIDHRLPGLGLSEGFEGGNGALGEGLAAEAQVPPIVVGADGEQEGEGEEDKEGQAEPEKVFAFHKKNRHALLGHRRRRGRQDFLEVAERCGYVGVIIPSKVRCSVRTKSSREREAACATG